MTEITLVYDSEVVLSISVKLENVTYGFLILWSRGKCQSSMLALFQLHVG